MAYLNNIPGAAQRISDTQPLIQGNFAAIQTFLDVNHVTFGAADEGKHKWITQPQQVAAPANFSANEMGLFVLNNAMTAQSEMYLRRAPSTDLPFTAKKVNTTGWSYLPSGILIKWGVKLANPEVVSTVTFPVAADTPVFTQLLSVQLTPTLDAGLYFISSTVGVNSVTGLQGSYAAASFQFLAGKVQGGAAFNVFYLAIGV